MIGPVVLRRLRQNVGVSSLQQSKADRADLSDETCGGIMRAAGRTGLKSWTNRLCRHLTGWGRTFRHRGAKAPVVNRSLVVGALLVLSSFSGAAALDPFWSGEELRAITRLSIAKLHKLLPDPSNRVADDPAAAALGKEFFFDTRFSANGKVACSTCHMPDHQFQDDLRVGRGIADGTRRTMPIAGTAYLPFFFWDGRKDSQWSQALGPLENPLEHGADRTMLVQLIAANYRTEYEAIFGKLPDFGALPPHAAPVAAPEVALAWQKLKTEQKLAVNLAFTNIGKAVAAFERTIAPPATRFDAFAAALAANDEPAANDIFSAQERNGLKLFLGQGDCVRCHGGPQFTDMRFHNLGLPDTSRRKDSGRSAAVLALAQDPFNCLGDYSDAVGPATCIEVKLLRLDSPDFLGAFKTPTLRGVSQRPPFMHTGQHATMQDVLKFYNEAPKAGFGLTELGHPLKLSDSQLSDLEAFLETLNVVGAPAN